MRAFRSWMFGLAGLALAGGSPAQKVDKLAPTLVPAPVTRPAPALPPAPPQAGGARQLTKADVDTWLDGYMPYALRSADIPGAVVAVVKDGRILTARGFGYADLAHRTPVDPERTLFRPGSVSKLFTWTAVMQMVEQGKLDLDADINRYLDFRIPPRDGQPVTLRQLMTHTGGFEERAKGLITYDPKRDMPLEAYLKAWTPHRIFAPGTTPAYSNWGTTLAAYMVQRVSGEEFNLYLERRIFGPLGMRYSTFRQPLPANIARYMATGYPKPGEAKGFEYVVPAPAGALSASGADMARFMLAHLNRGELNGRRILRPETADVMHQSPLGKVNPLSLMPPLNRMELGFFETNLNGREVIGHLGDLQAFHTSLHLFLREDVGFYVSFNSIGHEGAVSSLRTAVFEDFADRYFPNIAPPDGRVDAKTAAEHARMMTGNWLASRRAQSSFLFAIYGLLGQTTVSVGPRGELVIPSITNAAKRPLQWVEVAPFVWRDTFGHSRIAAKVINGEVARWTFDLAAPFEVFDRVPAGISAAWLLPLCYFSLAVLLLTFLHWPVTWWTRRSYKAAHPLAGRPLGVYRAVRLMAGLAIALVVAWAITATSILGGAEPGGGSDAWDMLLQVLSAIVFVGAALIAGWNLLVTWRGGRRWTGKLWSVLVLLASLVLLYVAVRFHLMAMTVQY